jgi:hypothetical protein
MRDMAPTELQQAKARIAADQYAWSGHVGTVSLTS